MQQVPFQAHNNSDSLPKVRLVPKKVNATEQRQMGLHSTGRELPRGTRIIACLCHRASLLTSRWGVPQLPLTHHHLRLRKWVSRWIKPHLVCTSSAGTEAPPTLNVLHYNYLCYDGLVKVEKKPLPCRNRGALLKLARGNTQIGTISPSLHLRWLTASVPAFSAVRGRVGQVPTAACTRGDTCAETLQNRHSRSSAEDANPHRNCVQNITKKIYI